ncbi:hypothetical protein LTR84_010230 [Exophiala bonariae]|uniref:Reverse transcriptase domain-containing protein n=1 Tax=Exophiala bonariae TaxID=1690606 RepID=A0AAV9MU11_9EURO|nr:hypothetical protein LTR84_010230 [Exophiala bonariae]
MTSAALPETLRSVTSTKISELKKQRDRYETVKSDILRDAGRVTDKLERTRLLLRGVYRQARIKAVDDEPSDSDGSDFDYDASNPSRTRYNQQLFLQQAQKDPAFAPGLVQEIQDDLLRELELKSVQHAHAQFFSELVTEWLSSAVADPSKGSQAASVDDSSFENIGRKEMHEQRAQWESIVFEKSKVDQSRIKEYLAHLFTSEKVVKIAHKEIETSTKLFSQNLWYDKEFFDAENLKLTIEGVLQTDILSDEKNVILKSFQNNKEVLQEVADVLNMRYASLDTWDWSTVDGAITVHQRKQLNGKYRIFMEEEVLDAILLHAIGMKFAVHFKACLSRFFESLAWKTAATNIPKIDRERREYFLGADQGTQESATVEGKRKIQYKQEYFLTQLPITEAEGVRGYGDADGDVSRSDRKSPVETKQALLHLLITEAILAQDLRPGKSHTVIRSDFQWFGPSLPHETIFAVLEFFGVTSEWLDFFRKFLQAPMRFAQDGPDGQFQVRKKGVPMSHALSDVFGEAVLFVMDYAVNHATQNYLYRLHDDFWFWGSEDLCIRGWEAMTKFAEVMGIQFNKEKTGTVIFDQITSFRQEHRSGTESDTDEDEYLSTKSRHGLPKGEVRWGFLRLDAQSRRFVIDQSMVDDHIQELQRQLSHCTSILSYIQAYNAYLARFFSNNFGKPSYAFGREHIDNMIDTFVRIEKAIFPENTVTAHLNKLVKEKFDMEDIPDGVWYWPVQMGGMDLRNPLVPLYCMRDNLRGTPQKILQNYLDFDEAEYLVAKDRFDRRSHSKKNHRSFGDEFMSSEEYLRYREERSTFLGTAYDRLLEIPQEFAAFETNEIAAFLDKLPPASRGSRASKSGITKPFHRMKPYWKWVLAVYGSQIMEKYGSLQIVDAAQVPLGVVSVMKAGKIRWQG